MTFKALLETQGYTPELAGKIDSTLNSWGLTTSTYHTLASLSGGTIEGLSAYKVIADLRAALAPPPNVVQLVSPAAPELSSDPEPIMVSKTKRKPARKVKDNKET